jgi:tRNA(Arg) A34 adenosine deaminase TadA
MAVCQYNNLSTLSSDVRRYRDVQSLPALLQTGVRLARNASLACEGRYCIGACLIHKGQGQFCVGSSMDRTHPLQKRFSTKFPQKVTLHAEISALSRLRREAELECMVVVRTHRSSGLYASSKPCDICLGALMTYEVGSIVYFEDDWWHRVYL